MQSKKPQNISLKKAIVFLTNFWDANLLLEQRFVFIKLSNGEYVKINFLMDEKKNPNNFEVYSIALQHPSFEKLPYVSAAFKGRIDEFCPTWDLLNRYHAEKDWVAYCKDYIVILKKRKEDIRNWMQSLDFNKIYFLCCWENTSGKSNCHRELVHRAFQNSSRAQGSLVSIFRNGASIFKSKSERDRFGAWLTPTRRQRFTGTTTAQTNWRVYPEEDVTFTDSDSIMTQVNFIGVDAMTGQQFILDVNGLIQPIENTELDDLLNMNDIAIDPRFFANTDDFDPDEL